MNANTHAKPRPAAKSRRRTALVVAIIVGMTASLGAWADWAVNDSEAIGHLKEIRKSIGDKGNRKDLLEYQQNQSTVTKGDFDANAQKGEQQGRYKDPDVMFKSTDVTLTGNATAKLSSVDMSDDTRCPKPKTPDAPKVVGVDTGSVISSAGSATGSGIPDQQYKLCKDILETQKARFKYNVMMSELADIRYQRLQQIERDRGNIDALAAGKLQDNTNRMLALIALIQIDQQQQKTYNDAYSSRLAYLRGMQDRLSQMAVNGTNGTNNGGPLGPVGGQVVNDAATMAVMTLALGDNSPLHSKKRSQ